MACNYPMQRINTKVHGSYIRDVCPDLLKKERNGGIILSRTEYDFLRWKDTRFNDICQDIPCGKCIACRLEYSRQWAMRCVNEARCYPCNVFVTLTYDNDNLPFSPFFDVETGAIEYKPSLQPQHMTKFMKDLRRYYDYHYNWQGIRFFGCGEFGDLHQRPHFHLILFNCEFDDKKLFFSRQVNGRTINTYQSQRLQNIWNKGMCTVSDVNYETACYVARYIMKKQVGKNVKNQRQLQRVALLGDSDMDIVTSNEKNEIDWVHEFTRSSRRPGIGREYYDRHKDVMYSTDEMFIPTEKGLLSVKPAKYYDKLYDIENPLHMASIKECRNEVAKNRNIDVLSRTDLTDVQMHQNNEERLKRAITYLPRNVD